MFKSLGHVDLFQRKQVDLLLDRQNKTGKKLFNNFVNQSCEDLKESFQAFPSDFRSKRSEYATLQDLKMDKAPTFSGKYSYFFPQRTDRYPQNLRSLDSQSQLPTQINRSQINQQRDKRFEGIKQKIDDMRQYEKRLRQQIMLKEKEIQRLSQNSKEPYQERQKHQSTSEIINQIPITQSINQRLSLKQNQNQVERQLLNNSRLQYNLNSRSFEQLYRRSKSLCPQEAQNRSYRNLLKYSQSYNLPNDTSFIGQRELVNQRNHISQGNQSFLNKSYSSKPQDQQSRQNLNGQIKETTQNSQIAERRQPYQNFIIQQRQKKYIIPQSGNKVNTIRYDKQAYQNNRYNSEEASSIRQTYE